MRVQLNEIKFSNISIKKCMGKKFWVHWSERLSRFGTLNWPHTETARLGTLNRWIWPVRSAFNQPLVCQWRQAAAWGRLAVCLDKLSCCGLQGFTLYPSLGDCQKSWKWSWNPCTLHSLAACCHGVKLAPELSLFVVSDYCVYSFSCERAIMMVTAQGILSENVKYCMQRSHFEA